MHAIRSARLKHRELKYSSLALAALLVACGGGDDSTSSTGTTTPVTSTDVTTTFSGVAATGAALASATVNITCASGSGSGTTGSTGSYSVAITNITLPCVLKAASSDGNTVLYSVTSATATSTNTQVANITPLTQLLVASLTGTEPATFFSGFGASTASSVTDSAITAAQTAVLTTLSNAGIDTTSLTSTSLVSGTLVAGSTSNAYDVALEALAATLASSGTTLATLTTTVAATTTASTTTTSTTTSGTASLPADMLLKTAASSCSALRSGTYRVVLPTQALAHQTPLSIQYGKIEVNASTLAIVFTDGSTGSWVPNGPCRFTDADDGAEIVVSPAGVLVARGPNSGGGFTVAIGFPEQSHTLAELSGNWNLLGMEDNATDTAYTGIATSVTLDAAGLLTNVSLCQDDAAWNVASSCLPEDTAGAVLRVASDGGFSFGTGGGEDRVFAYRAGGGELMLIGVNEDGAFSVWTKQRSNAMPAVGRVRTTWNLAATNQLLATPAISQSTNTVTTVDTAAGSYVRLAKTVGGTDEHLETVLVNSPRDGYNFRAAATVTGTDGTTAVPVSEWTALDLRGMGLSALVRPASKHFMFSVQQP